MPPDLAAVLHDLARDVQRLIPDRRDPEAFFVEKSEIAARLRQLAQYSSGTVRGCSTVFAATEVRNRL